MATFEPIPRDWTGQTAYIIGGGPSLIGFDFDPLRKLPCTIAVKAAAEHLPWARCYFSMDMHDFAARQSRLDDSGFKGERWIACPEKRIAEMPSRSDFHFVKRNNVGLTGLSFDSHELRGFNSGFTALNFAFLRGAQRIVLFGLDFVKAGYWYDPQSVHWVNARTLSTGIETRDDYIEKMKQDFTRAAKELQTEGVAVFIWGEASALDCFPRLKSLSELF